MKVKGNAGKNCFVCSYRHDADASRCNKCGWGGGDGLAENDPRYIVMLSMIDRLRAQEDKDWLNEQWIRLEPTEREYAVLQQGEQIHVAKQVWRITSRSNGIFWLRCLPTNRKWNQIPIPARVERTGH